MAVPALLQFFLLSLLCLGLVPASLQLSENCNCIPGAGYIPEDLASLGHVRDVDWGSLLRKAAANGNANLVSALLRLGTDPSAPDSQGVTPLHEAARNGNREAARLLLDAGAKVDANDAVQQTPLNFASSTKNAALVNLLLDRGADIDHPDVHLRTPVLWSTWHGSLPATQVLVNRGANTAAVNSGGRNPLQEAKHYKHPLVAAWLENWLSKHA